MGTIVSAGNGKFRARQQVDGKRYYAPTRASKPRAKIDQARMEAALAEDDWPAFMAQTATSSRQLGEVTFSEAWEVWHASVKDTVSERTHGQYKTDAKWILERFGSSLLSEIRFGDVDNHFVARRAAGAKRTTQRKELRQMVNALDRAYLHDEFDDPKLLLKLARLKITGINGAKKGASASTEADERRPFRTVDDARVMLSCLRAESGRYPLWQIWAVAICLGLRPMEVLSLRRETVFLRRRATWQSEDHFIPMTLRVDGKPTKRRHETGSDLALGYHPVAIAPELIHLLAGRRAHCTPDAPMLWFPGLPAFDGVASAKIAESRLKRPRLRAMAAAAGRIGTGYSLGSCRHTFRTWGAELEIDERWLATQCCHALPNGIQDRYTHLDVESARKAVEAMRPRIRALLA